jgi:hypothetical protein
VSGRRRAAQAGLALALLAAVATTAPAAPDLEVGGLTALAPTSPGPELVDNGGFEGGGDAPGWQLRDAGTFAIDGGAGRQGQAALRMAGADRAEAFATVSQTVTLEPGYYTLEGWVKTTRLAEEAKRAGVRLCLDGRPRLNWWHCTASTRGTADWKPLAQPAIPVRDPGTYRVTVGAYARPDGAAWFDDVSLRAVRRPPLEVFLLYPNFRGLLFDDRSPAIRVSVQAHGAPAGARVRLTLVDEAGGAVRERREVTAPAAARVETLDASRLGHGTYLVRAELLDASGAERFRHPEYRVVKAPASARQRLPVWYDERNVTHFDGRPRFVLGLYTTSGYANSPAAYAKPGGWGTERMAEAPLDLVINYWLGATPIPALNAYMDDLAGRGIRYLHTVNFYHEDDPRYRSVPHAAARDGDAVLNRWIARTLAGHRGFAGFYTADERKADMIPKVFRQHRELRRGAPGAVDYAVLGDGWQEQAPLWRDALDVLGLDPYPLVKAEGNHLAMVGEWTRLGQEAVMGSRPLWMVIQFFPLTRAGGWPTYEQLRDMSWMAIVEGAHGLFYWSFGARGLAWVKDPREREQHWRNLVRVTREIRTLEPVLLAPDAPLLERESSGGAVRALGKATADGGRYLFAYNTTAKPVTVTWTLAHPARQLAPLGEGDPTAVDGTTVSQSFAPYEVKRFRVR